MLKLKQKTDFTAIFTLLLYLLYSCSNNAEQNKNENLKPVNSLILSDAQIQLANIRFADVNQSSISRNKTFTGILKVNELSALNISSRANGRIQKLYFRNTGETVNEGDSLYKFYSDELVAAEREYFTLQSGNWNFNGKYQPSLVLEDKLLFLGMLPSQIEQLKKDGKILFSITILSPAKGTIRSIKVIEGQYVNAGITLFELADYNKLWVEAQAYQEDLPYLKEGMPSNITIPVAGNMDIMSKIAFINPSFEKGKNVILIRTLIDNPENKLYPGMIALMNVHSQKEDGYIIPASAVIVDKNGSRVWIRKKDGSFSARMVTTGIQSEDSVLILSGLINQESVVTSGAYLLNSELILKKGTVTDVAEGM